MCWAGPVAAGGNTENSREGTSSNKLELVAKEAIEPGAKELFRLVFCTHILQFCTHITHLLHFICHLEALCMRMRLSSCCFRFPLVLA